MVGHVPVRIPEADKVCSVWDTFSRATHNKHFQSSDLCQTQLKRLSTDLSNLLNSKLIEALKKDFSITLKQLEALKLAGEPFSLKEIISIIVKIKKLQQRLQFPSFNQEEVATAQSIVKKVSYTWDASLRLLIQSLERTKKICNPLPPKPSLLTRLVSKFLKHQKPPFERFIDCLTKHNHFPTFSSNKQELFLTAANNMTSRSFLVRECQMMQDFDLQRLNPSSVTRSMRNG